MKMKTDETNGKDSTEHLMETANADYETRKTTGESVSIAEIEKRHGIEATKLKNWRSNREKLKGAKVPAVIAIAGAATANGATLVRVPLNVVTVCPLNPRKKLDAAGIDEMARSILQHGIIQPPVARMVPKGEGYHELAHEGKYEVVYGQRRLNGLLRARELARMEDLPEPPFEIDLLLREMDDQTVIEEAWVENLQRVDVSVREEALGFEALLDLIDEDGKPKYSVNKLALKLGKSPFFISMRLKLKGVPEPLWDALEEELVGVRQLELVGCLPTPEMREKAAAAVLRPRFRVSPPLTVKETRAVIRDEFMVSLGGVEWDLKDAELVPVVVDANDHRIYGGACHDCDFRTGNNPDIQASLSDGSAKRGWKGNSCMLPACYQKKKSAIWSRTKKLALDAGSKVLTDQDAKKTFAQWGGEDDLDRSAGMVVLSSRPGYAETGHHAEDTLPTWESMIGDKVPSEEVVLARNPRTGTIRKLLPQKLAIKLAEAALKEQGKESPFANRKQEQATPKGPKERSEGDLEREILRRVDDGAAVWLRSQQKGGMNLGELARQELIVFFAMEAAWVEGAKDVADFLGIPLLEEEENDEEKAEAKLESEVRLAASKGGGWWLLMEIAAATGGGLSGYNNVSKERLKQIYETAGMPVAALMDDAKASVEAEEKARLTGDKKGGKKGKKD